MPIPSYDGGEGIAIDIFNYGSMRCVTEFLLSGFRGAIIKSLFNYDFMPKNFSNEVICK